MHVCVGPIPRKIGDLSMCNVLALHNNNLTGPLLEVHCLGCPCTFIKAWSWFAGPIPSSIGNMKELQVLMLRSNQLTGL